MRLRTVIVVGSLLLVALVLQTSLISQVTLFSPDLILFLSIVLALTRLRPESVLAISFAFGLSVDLLGSGVLGLRAIVMTIVAYLAVRTRERADVGRIATGLWAGALSLIGVVVLLGLGTVFGQDLLLTSKVVEQLIFVPLSNALLTLLIGPAVVRLIDRDATAFRYA